MTDSAEKTTVGNYFISNYPPYSTWEMDLTPKAIDALQGSVQPDTPLGPRSAVDLRHLEHAVLGTGLDARRVRRPHDVRARQQQQVGRGRELEEPAAWSGGDALGHGRTRACAWFSGRASERERSCVAGAGSARPMVRCDRERRQCA